ncbi:MAG: transcriptional repressor [Pseudomonadota bacterium]
MGVQVSAPLEAAARIKSPHTQNDNKQEPLRPNEQLVYEALCQSETPLKAYDLLDDLHDQGLRAPMTIYRALEALKGKGYAKKIESMNAFVATKPDRKTQARAYLICKDCQQVREILLEDAQVETLFSPATVAVEDVRIEAYGECHDVCRD